MSAFVLVHGAWYPPSVWGPVVAAIEARGRRAIIVDLPSEDVDAGAEQYARAVVDAAAGEDGVVVVGHTLAGLTLPLVPALRPVERLVYVNPVLPEIGRSIARQSLQRTSGRNTDEGRRYDRLARSFWADREAVGRLLAADCPKPLVDELFAGMRPQARKPTREITPLREWPAVPNTAVIYVGDADLSVDWMRGISRDRLGVEPIELPGSQVGFVADPDPLVDLLLTVAATRR